MRAPPSPFRLGRRDLAVALAALLLLAATRLATLASDPWEWDEVLFVNAVEKGFDVRAHRPHPPGYPLFVEAARGVAALGVDPFRAATLVAAAGGLLAAAGTAALLLALDVPFAFALLGGVFYALVPSVWIHAVRPLSDAPAAAALLLAATALVTAVRRRSPRSLAWGVVLSAAACCVRPQTGAALVPLALAAAVALRRVRGGPRALLASLALGVGLSVAAWTPLVRGSGGWASFGTTLRSHARWVAENDTQPLGTVLSGKVQRRWWRDPFGVTELFWVVVGVAAAGAALAPRKALGLALVVGPLVATTVLVQSPGTAPRYVTVAMPALAGLFALGAWRLSTLRRGRAGVAVGAVLVLGAMAAVAVPRAVRLSGPTPSAAALAALRDDPAFAGRTVVYTGELTVHAERYLAGRPIRQAPDEGPIVLSPGELGVANEREVEGLAAVRTFDLGDPLLGRLTRNRYRTVRVYDPGLPAGR